MIALRVQGARLDAAIARNSGVADGPFHEAEVLGAFELRHANELQRRHGAAAAVASRLLRRNRAARTRFGLREIAGEIGNRRQQLVRAPHARGNRQSLEDPGTLQCLLARRAHTARAGTTRRLRRRGRRPAAVRPPVPCCPSCASRTGTPIGRARDRAPRTSSCEYGPGPWFGRLYSPLRDSLGRRVPGAHNTCAFDRPSNGRGVQTTGPGTEDVNGFPRVSPPAVVFLRRGRIFPPARSEAFADSLLTVRVVGER